MGAAAGGPDEVGLVERARWADVAVTAAGLTPYELACAGVPAAILAGGRQPAARSRGRSMPPEWLSGSSLPSTCPPPWSA